MIGRSSKQQNSRAFSTSRLEAFSDGVFAIAITLLVLEISIPEDAKNHLLRSLVAEWPIYLAYMVSFATIGAAWYAHSVITEFLDKMDRGFARLNLLLLMLVSFLPFPTKLLAGFLDYEESEWIAVTLYGTVLLGISLLLSLLWEYARRNKLVKAGLREQDIAIISQRLRPGLASYVIMIAIGFFLPVVAVIGYLLTAFFILFPLHRHEK